MNDNLYVIIPYFNFYKNIYRISNLLKVLSSFKNSKNFLKCKVLIAEAHYEEVPINKNAKWNEDDSFFELNEANAHVPQVMDFTRSLMDKNYEKLNNIFLQFIDNKNYFHVKYPIPQKIWIKENLINLTIKEHLPKDWEYFCWIDGDVIFDNENWINETKELLNQSDIIQMFSTCFNQMSYSKKNYIGHSGYIYTERKKEKNNNSILNEMLVTHMGYGWAMNRKLYEKIGKLWETNIVGAADSIIARCAIQKLSEEEILNTEALNVIYSPNYGKKLFEYYSKFKDCKYGYLNNNLFHIYHGEMQKRQYMARHKILQKYKYDDSFLERNEFGVLYLKNESLEKEIEHYLINREN
jgi:hypothetical protein